MSVGNLHKTPWHGSVGYIYLPFGVYPFSFISTVNQDLDTLHAQAINVGYASKHFYGTVYGFGRSGKVNNQEISHLPSLKYPLVF